MKKIVEIAPYRFAGSWIVGPKTSLIDRFTPQAELIRWPGAEYSGGTFTIERDESPSERRRDFSRRERIMRRFRSEQPIDLGEALAIDYRFEPYLNWSHQLNNYLAESLLIRDTIAPGEAVTILLHAAMSAKVIDLYRHFGFTVLATDAPVRARFMRGEYSLINIFRSHAHIAVAPHLERVSAEALGVTRALPRKVYLARHKGRAILNEAEIEPLLTARGFEKVYAEELSGKEQISSICSLPLSSSASRKSMPRN